MRNNNLHKKHASRSLRLLLIYILAGMFISACGGGISGTGDGGTPIVIGPENNTGVADSSDAGADGNSLDATASPTESDQSSRSPDVSQLLPESLRLLIARNENVSSAQPLATQLNAFQQEVDLALQIADTVAGTSEENISDEFDTTIRYSLNNTETVIARSANAATSYLFSTSNERVIQVLQQDGNLTLRYLNRNLNSLLQATIDSRTDGTIIIEADLNQNGIASYLKILSTASRTSVFGQHPTDTSIERQRELLDPSGNILTVQTCTAASQNCDIDSSWSNSDPATDTQFSTDMTTIDNRLAVITSPVASLPEGVNEAVLSQETLQRPTDEQIQCGIQRLTNTGETNTGETNTGQTNTEETNTIRAFCFLPQPLGPTSLFSETLAGGEIFYQLLE